MKVLIKKMAKRKINFRKRNISGVRSLRKKLTKSIWCVIHPMMMIKMEMLMELVVFRRRKKNKKKFNRKIICQMKKKKIPPKAFNMEKQKKMRKNRNLQKKSRWHNLSINLY